MIFKRLESVYEAPSPRISKGIFLERRFNEIEKHTQERSWQSVPEIYICYLCDLNFWNSPSVGTNVVSEGHQEEDVPSASTLGFPRWPKPKAKYTGTVSLAQISYVWLLPFLCLTTLQTSKGIDNIWTPLPGHSPQSLPLVGFSTVENFFSSIFVGQTIEAPFLQTDSVGGDITIDLQVLILTMGDI